MKILACDTSCDETSVAVVENDWILSNKISSQIELHKQWGGVVPNIAKRAHQENIDIVIREALNQAGLTIEEIDVFAVTKGPGLAIALEVGLKKFKELALQHNKPLVAINHMEGHIYSALSRNANGNPKFEFNTPVLALLISGGHTEFVLMKDHGDYEIIGQTLDDAVGEAFDKVAKMLDLGYPGGPVLEVLAKEGDENKYQLPLPMQYSKDANMSFSGLKTAVMRLVKEELGEKYLDKGPKVSYKPGVEAPNSNFQIPNTDGVIARSETTKQSLGQEKLVVRENYNDDQLPISNYENSSGEEVQIIKDICASFQKTATVVLLLKTEAALKHITEVCSLKTEDLIIAGGVSTNLYIRKKFRARFGEKHRIHFPTNKKLYGDNAGMIGVAAYYNALHGKFVEDFDGLDRLPNWRIDKTNI